MPEALINKIGEKLSNVDKLAVSMAGITGFTSIKSDLQSNNYQAAVLLSIVKHIMTHNMVLYKNMGQYEPLNNAVTVQIGERTFYIFGSYVEIQRKTYEYHITVRFSKCAESFLIAKYAKDYQSHFLFPPYEFAYHDHGIKDLVKWLIKPENNIELGGTIVVGHGDALTQVLEYMTQVYQQIHAAYNNQSTGGTRKARVHSTTRNDKVLYKGYKIQKDGRRTFIQTKLGEISMKEVKMHQKSMAKQKKDSKKTK